MSALLDTWMKHVRGIFALSIALTLRARIEWEAHVILLGEGGTPCSETAGQLSDRKELTDLGRLPNFLSYHLPLVLLIFFDRTQQVGALPTSQHGKLSRYVAGRRTKLLTSSSAKSA